MRRNRIFAYDLVVCHGAVNSRVALLLRSIEAKPSAPNSSQVLILELYSNSGIYLGEKDVGVRSGFSFTLREPLVLWGLEHINAQVII